jgi:hypothetical protein
MAFLTLKSRGFVKEFRGEKQSDCVAHLFCKFSSCVWSMQLLKMHDYGLVVAFLSAAGTWKCVDIIHKAQ